MNNTKLKALLASYARSVVGAAATLYLAGVTDPADLAYSLLGALLPVAVRYINPKDAAFGRTTPPSAEEVAAVLKDVKIVKAPASKSQQKRVAVQKTSTKK